MIFLANFQELLQSSKCFNLDFNKVLLELLAQQNICKIADILTVKSIPLTTFTMVEITSPAES